MNTKWHAFRPSVPVATTKLQQPQKPVSHGVLKEHNIFGKAYVICCESAVVSYVFFRNLARESARPARSPALPEWVSSRMPDTDHCVLYMNTASRFGKRHAAKCN